MDQKCFEVHLIFPVLNYIVSAQKRLGTVNKYLLPEMELIIKSNRRYIYPEAMSHLIGYTGKLSDKDYDSDKEDEKEKNNPANPYFRVKKNLYNILKRYP